MYKISVVMSVFNAEKFLGVAIESILNQTFTNFEFIIINDGSTDNSLKIIKSYTDKRIIIVNQENRGLSKSLNKGIELSKSGLIARMDADDISNNKRLEIQYNYMTNNVDCVLLGSNAIVVDLNKSFLFQSNLPTNDKFIRKRLPESSFFHSSTIFRKDYFYKAGKYPEEIFHYFEDKILWNKLANFGELCNLEESLITYRIVPESISNLPIKNLKELRILANEIIKNNNQISKNDLQKIREITAVSEREKLGNYYLKIGTWNLKNNLKIYAIKNLLKSLYYLPLKSNTFLKLIACIIPHTIIKRFVKR